MEGEFNSQKYQEWRDNLIKISDFKLNYPNLFTLASIENGVMKYLDSDKQLHLVGIIFQNNISLFMDLDSETLQKFDDDACVELYNTKNIVNMIIWKK